MKNIIIAVLVALFGGALSCYLVGRGHEANKCDAEKYKDEIGIAHVIIEQVNSEAEKLKEIVAEETERTSQIEKEFSELRKQYAALKKLRDAEKNEAIKSAQSDVRLVPRGNTLEIPEGWLYAPNIVLADDLLVSDELRDYRNGAIRTLLRAY